MLVIDTQGHYQRSEDYLALCVPAPENAQGTGVFYCYCRAGDSGERLGLVQLFPNVGKSDVV